MVVGAKLIFLINIAVRVKGEEWKRGDGKGEGEAGRGGGGRGGMGGGGGGGGVWERVQ